jgi:uncharacterized protein YgbK (DUF1537 family)
MRNNNGEQQRNHEEKRSSNEEQQHNRDYRNEQIGRMHSQASNLDTDRHTQQLPVKRLLCYYGDDFTGSTDVLEALFQTGLRTVLFLEAPTPDRLREQFHDVQCFGVAGVGRSLSPAAMEQELRPLFETLKTAGAAVVHYKICSTFDSSPDTGSIGKAAEIGRDVFGSRYVPLLAGVPYLHRYTIFGNHFAAAGETVHRLDRHPTMSRHPMTPMAEADLRKHLQKQTTLSTSLFDILALDGDYPEVEQRLSSLLRDEQPDMVLFDVLDERRLETAGRLIWAEAAAAAAKDQATATVKAKVQMKVEAKAEVKIEAKIEVKTTVKAEGQAAAEGEGGLFVIGSSGVEYALSACWKADGLLAASAGQQKEAAGAVERLLVVSGSCSPITEQQIRLAEEAGFVGIRVPVNELIRPDRAEAALARLKEEARMALASGRSVVLYSAAGPNDDSIALIREALAEQGFKAEDSGRLLGSALGVLTRQLVAELNLSRILIAGGDTSGYITRELGIYALECRAVLDPGAPLCRAFSNDPQFDGLELVLKGGQVGGEHFFEKVRRGG